MADLCRPQKALLPTPVLPQASEEGGTLAYHLDDHRKPRKMKSLLLATQEDNFTYDFLPKMRTGSVLNGYS